MDDATLQLKQAVERYANAAHELQMAEGRRAAANIAYERARTVRDEATKALREVALANGQTERFLYRGESVIIITTQSIETKKIERDY